MLRPTPQLDVTVAEGLEPGDVIVVDRQRRLVQTVSEPRDGAVSIGYVTWLQDRWSYRTRHILCRADREYHVEVRNAR